MRLPLLKTACWFTRRFHQFPARWRVVGWINRHESDFQALPATTVRIARGCRMFIEPGDAQGLRIYRAGLNPYDSLGRLFCAVLRPGDTAIDVGANFGYYTVLAARLVGPSGTVHAFEASARMFAYLQQTVALNAFDQTVLHWRAVAERSGRRTFHEAPAGLSGLGSLRSLGAQTAGVSVVPAIALDDLLADLPRVRLIKIDVEGADFLALQGMRRLLERDHPYLISEFNAAWFRELGQSADDAFQFLVDHGYGVERIAPTGLEPLAAAPPDACNVFCIPGVPAEQAVRHGAAAPVGASA